MGGGNDPKPARPSRTPADTPTALLGDVPTGGGDGTVDFCQLTHTLNCATVPAAQVAVADPVHLQVTPYLVVTRGSEVIGRVIDDIAPAIADCLRDGFEMAGKVLAVEPDRQHFRITVSGRKR